MARGSISGRAYKGTKNSFLNKLHSSADQNTYLNSPRSIY